jgi:plasmid stabilization system protein ParE
MIVDITDAAELDLEHIGDVIARDNPTRDASFVRELVARCEKLSDMPRRFGLVPGHERDGLRKLAHQGYLIFYTIEIDHVSVVRILHGAMDYERVLFTDED